MLPVAENPTETGFNNKENFLIWKLRVDTFRCIFIQASDNVIRMQFISICDLTVLNVYFILRQLFSLKYKVMPAAPRAMLFRNHMDQEEKR